MGFGEKLAKFALQKAQQLGKEMNAAQEKAQKMSDVDLINRLDGFFSTDVERGAYRAELKKRGWYQRDGEWFQR